MDCSGFSVGTNESLEQVNAFDIGIDNVGK